MFAGIGGGARGGVNRIEAAELPFAMALDDLLSGMAVNVFRPAFAIGQLCLTPPDKRAVYVRLVYKAWW